MQSLLGENGVGEELPVGRCRAAEEHGGRGQEAAVRSSFWILVSQRRFTYFYFPCRRGKESSRR